MLMQRCGMVWNIKRPEDLEYRKELERIDYAPAVNPGGHASFA